MDAKDYFEIQNLLFRYAHLNDRGDYEAVGKLFEHANVYMPGDEKPSSTNATAMTALWTKWNRIYPDTKTPKTRHVTTNVIIEPDGPDRAKTHSYVIVFQATDKFPLQPIIGGAYRDIFAKVNGEWRFIERREEMDLFGDLSHHLALPYG